MASQVEICNRALQALGARRITSITEDSVNARACNVVYEPCKLALLRAHRWRFAIARAELAAASVAPAWGRANSFPLPSDFVKMVPDYPEDNSNSKDWEIEGLSILSDDSDPIYIRYIYNVTDPNIMDPLFREAFSSAMAMELCEELTQSNTKLAAIKDIYKDKIREARRANAFESIAAKPPEDDWITVRN